MKVDGLLKDYVGYLDLVPTRMIFTGESGKITKE
jgi:hypothetical protein